MHSFEQVAKADCECSLCFLQTEETCKENTELKKKNDEPYDMLPSITMKTADNKCVVGWVPSQADMLAEDWKIVEEK